ncbi:MAG: hypothetical protein Q9211_005576 [Gyalolechia sp. 1 TL-2023]
MAVEVGYPAASETVSLPPLSLPPTVPLPALPLQATAQAPPPTPRNAGQLYGEFSWPSLNITMLVSRLEEIAERTEAAEDANGLVSPNHIPPGIRYWRMRCPSLEECTCGDVCPPEDFLAAVSHDVEVACASHPPLPYHRLPQITHDVVPRDDAGDVDSASDDIYRPCSEGGDSDSETDNAAADDASGFLDSEDWAELCRMLGWWGECA